MIEVIKKIIEVQLKLGEKKFIIYPFGKIGMYVEEILQKAYGVDVAFKIDENLYKFNSEIKELSFLKNINCSEYIFILASTNKKIYTELKNNLKMYVPDERIVEIQQTNNELSHKWTTKIGKYCHGTLLTKNKYIESIGSFCSFAEGCAVVPNQEMNCITTHPMIYAGKNIIDKEFEYKDYKIHSWYFEGVEPHSTVKKIVKTKIGNDVWLGTNVIIKAGVNIGNGVIAGAGAIITKDVPDYAIVGGVPAKIIRYRYTKEQIEALNRIQWWEWTDEEIRYRYDDLYLSVEDFIEKYDIK